MKSWTPDHVRLANAAVDVRARLLHVSQRLTGHTRDELIACANHLHSALKARPPVRSRRRREVTGDVYSTGQPTPA